MMAPPGAKRSFCAPTPATTIWLDSLLLLAVLVALVRRPPGARSAPVTWIGCVLLLLAVVVTPVIHLRSFAERLLLPSVEHLPPMAPDEPLFIGLRAGLMVLMVAFGASFAYAVMGRISLLVGRLQFLLGDWLGVI